MLNSVMVVDDESSIRSAVEQWLSLSGFTVQLFSRAEECLAALPAHFAGVILSDVRMPGMGGLALLAEVQKRDAGLPVILLTGHGDVPMAVDALKRGAFDFFEKPFNDNKLMDRVQEALAASENSSVSAAAHKRLASLSAREREVLDLILDGKMNKVIADDLGISMRTVEVHRAHIFDKMNVKTAVELARLLK